MFISYDVDGFAVGRDVIRLKVCSWDVADLEVAFLRCSYCQYYVVGGAPSSWGNTFCENLCATLTVSPPPQPSAP